MSRSLEALEKIIFNFGECEVGSRYYDLEFNKDIDTIKQDLERLEQLEMENKKLKLEIKRKIKITNNHIQAVENYRRLKEVLTNDK